MAAIALDAPPADMPAGWVVWAEDGRLAHLVADRRGGVTMDAFTEHVENLKAGLPSYADRMREALDFVAAHPGCCKADIYRATDVYPKPYGASPNSITRLFWRGLVYDLGRSNRARLYVWQPQNAPENDRPAGVWAPAAHP